ncbi:hypothetical protein PF003_g11874 [Phytophthora fragariae]|nr:hypothetical protein PF003_g11874 [Phytophthora fragariae]
MRSRSLASFQRRWSTLRPVLKKASSRSKLASMMVRPSSRSWFFTASESSSAGNGLMVNRSLPMLWFCFRSKQRVCATCWRRVKKESERALTDAAACNAMQLRPRRAERLHKCSVAAFSPQTLRTICSKASRDAAA